MKRLNSIRFIVLTVGGFFLNAAYANNSTTLHSLTDSEMSAATGQALMSLTYISPKDNLNLESQRTGISNPSSGGVGFYKLGLEGTLELNANIKKLQLGCGGINGAGACDIDIDYLSLSGISDTNTGRASSSAKLTNPFTEIAIRNPNSASTREVLGFRVSSEKAEGLLTFGLENGPNKSGINSLSGYMEVAAAGGQVTVNSISGVCHSLSFSPSCTRGTGVDITGKATGTLCCDVGIASQKYNLDINIPNKGILSLPQQAITGKRITSAPLTATAVVNGIQLSGTINPRLTSLGNIELGNKNLVGVLNNLMVDVTIDEDLGYFHKASLNGTPASLSLQAKDIMWPGTKSVAQQGWWLEFSNPIDIGDITPTNAVDIASNTLSATLSEVSKYLDRKPIECGITVLSCVFSGTIDTGPMSLGADAAVPMALSNLELVNQKFAPNCYGPLKFC